MANNSETLQDEPARASHSAGLTARPFAVVLGLDLARQDACGFALDEALRIASRVTEGELHVVYVVAADTSEERTRQAAGLLRLYVSDKARALGINGPARVGLHVRSGGAAAQITQVAAEVGAAMIVLGTPSAPHLRSGAAGATAERIMTAASCPVFVAGPRPRAPAYNDTVVIDPPCPACVQQRFATDGRQWWCRRHSEHHRVHGHVYSYHSELPFTVHDSEVIPTGVD